ncbi:hypothetical protein EYF80_031557 [Liparis tanakae]|uniref:Uncharacterized protein n=1 Tax=Liparis tanakae TaxID=230148 RepID=A0A4Z2GX24_9TELE|nr:hypothetical protein EYF80_031557 [Liparis tanakae]
MSLIDRGSEEKLPNSPKCSSGAAQRPTEEDDDGSEQSLDVRLPKKLTPSLVDKVWERLVWNTVVHWFT